MTEITDAMVEAYLATSNAVVKAETSKLPLGSHILDDAVMAPIYRAACKAAIAAALAAQWQPIESAKKDGTYILVWQPDTSLPDQTVVSWDTNWGDSGWWMACDGKNFELPLRGKAPTRWQPLPAPPLKGE